MPEFWLESGYRLLDRDEDGRLAVTDDYLRAYFLRPEIEPVEESCDAERSLHESLMVDPFRSVERYEIDAVADPDARENYQILLEFRDRLTNAGTLEACYLGLMRESFSRVPPLFINQMVQLILRNILNEEEDALAIRSAEMLYRDQRVSLHEGAVLSADAETVDMQAASGGFGSLGQLIVQAGTRLKSVELDVLNEENAGMYWDRSNQFDLALDIRNPGPALRAFCRVLEKWIDHFFGTAVRIFPRPDIQDEHWAWHIGLDAEATQILNQLYQGEEPGNATLARILALFQLDFEDPASMRADLAGKPVYLGMAMTTENVLRLKPQNLLVNLPLAERT